MFGLVGAGGGAGHFATAFQLAFQGESPSAVGVYFYLARVFCSFAVLFAPTHDCFFTTFSAGCLGLNNDEGRSEV